MNGDVKPGGIRHPRRGTWIRAVAAIVATTLLASCTSSADAPDQSADDNDRSEAPAIEETNDVNPTAEPADTTTTTLPEVDLGTFDPPEVDETPLAVDPAIVSGALDNGLTYYVQSNDSPGSAVALRLVVRAGGVHEDPRGTGAAHFLEHMMFNGTEQFPGNTLDAALRRIGAEIGPDFNAYTTDSQTVYQIDVEDRGDNVEVAFDVLSQWAGAAIIDPAEVEAEAPVVREELRVRDESGDGLVYIAFENAYYLDTPYEGTNVSGTAETVEALTAADLRAYYDAWYRPDNMAVVAVGDRSTDDLVELITEAFSGLEARGDRHPAAPETALSALRSEPYVDVVVEPSFGDSYISVDIPVAANDRSTVGGSELAIVESLISLMVNNRLSEGVASGRLDLRRAGGGAFSVNHDLAYIGFNLDADDLVAGTETFMAELQSTIQNPFTESELARGADAIRSSVEQQQAQYDSIQDRALADALVQDFVAGNDLRAIDERTAATLDLLDAVDIDAVNNHYGWMMTSSAPIVLVVGPDEERTGTVEDHLAALDRARQSVADTFVDDVEEIDDLMDDPTPVEEVARLRLDRREGYELVFDNGTRVLFAESDIAEGQVVVVSQSPGGRAMLGDDAGPIAPTAVSIVAASGAGPWDPIQIRRFLADVEVSLTPYVSDFAEGISGSASTDDLDVLFELMHLQLTEPRVDPVPLRQQQEFARDAVERASLDSGTAATVAVQDGRSGGGRFAAVPTLREIDDLTGDDALAVWNDRFGALDDHVFVVVGDVDGERVADLARTWVGTLPEPAVDNEAPEQPALPGVVEQRLDVGSGTASGAYRLLMIGSSDETVENRVHAAVAETVIDDRIFTVIRETLGATYGGSASIEFSDPGDEVELVIAIDGDPGRIDEIAQAVNRELGALATGAMTSDDFGEAVSILESEYNFINNGFIIESLFDEASQPASRVITRQGQWEALQATRPADVTALLADIVGSNERVDVRNVPGG